jgi:hypothetical protein
MSIMTQPLDSGACVRRNGHRKSTPDAAPGAPKPHIAALRRFALAITVLNILGHLVFGFEQSYAQPFAAIATAYALEWLLESIDALIARRKPRYAGNWRNRIDFLLSPHITGLACAMLLYANEEIWPICFATAVAIGSKWIFRVRMPDASSKHFFNPSNFGITVTLLLFSWVGIAQPYMFTENLPAIGSWLLPAIIVVSGGYLNFAMTRRGPLVAGWLVGFVAQALTRHLVFGTPWQAPLMPLTGTVFMLFTFYMVTDPATTPSDAKQQVAFGAGLAAAYGLLVANHIVFGMFFGLTAICLTRGILMYAVAAAYRRAQRKMVDRPVRLLTDVDQHGAVDHREPASAAVK